MAVAGETRHRIRLTDRLATVSPRDMRRPSGPCGTRRRSFKGSSAASSLGLYASPRCEFWPDAVSYRDADLAHVVGHRQVTDAYLIALARVNGGLLATFDKGMARVTEPRVVLIP